MTVARRRRGRGLEMLVGGRKGCSRIPKEKDLFVACRRGGRGPGVWQVDSGSGGR